MKLKSIIFITILALGTLPLLILVSINLQNHIHRHETSLLENIRKRSELNRQSFTDKISSIQTDIRRLALLLNSQNIYVALQGNKGLPPSMSANLEKVVNNWYEMTPEVKSIILNALTAPNHITLKRNSQSGIFQFSAGAEPVYLDSIVKNQTQSDQFIFKAENDPSQNTKVIFFSKVPEGAQQNLIILEVNLSLLLPKDEMVLWLTPSGELHNFGEFADKQIFSKQPARSGNALAYEMGLKDKFSSNTPFVWESNSQQTIAWIPITSNKKNTPLLWTGVIADRGGAEQWRRSLIINIAIVIAATMVVIFCIANLIAIKIDHIKQNILQGLEKTLNNDKSVRFHWKGPQEITILADELNALAQRYFQTRSESIKAEEQLRESENRFRKLTSSAQDAIIMMDNNGDIAYWNKSAERIFGYSDHIAMGQPIHELLSLTREEEPPKNNSDDLSIAKPSSASDIIELLAKRKDGSEVPIELSLSATKIKNQWHAIWIVRDISERKQSEKEAELRRQQLVQADKMRSLGLLVSGVAHEINNPNSIAMLNTPMLTKSWEDVTPILEEYYKENGDFTVAGLDYSEMRQQVPQLFAELMDSTKRIKNIVKDLKDYARKDKPTLAEFLDSNQIIETAIRLTHNLVKKTTSSFHCNLCENCPQINGNRQRLEQVIINLIQNACEALTDPSQSITVHSSFDKEASAIVITVHDEGVGMSEETLSQITDPFYTTKRNSGGTGLGLSVSAGIIQEHGGTLTFSSSPSKGTKAQVRLPVPQPSVS